MSLGLIADEKVLDLWVQLMKNGGKNKSVAFIILVSVVNVGQKPIKKIKLYVS